jgi:hypothetical protein
MASSATDRMGGMFGVGASATGARPMPRLVLPEAIPEGPVAGVHGSTAGALARDMAGAVLVLGSAAALWAGFLAAIW